MEHQRSTRHAVVTRIIVLARQDNACYRTCLVVRRVVFSAGTIPAIVWPC